jgi:hypothetical protein
MGNTLYFMKTALKSTVFLSWKGTLYARIPPSETASLQMAPGRYLDFGDIARGS